jgi:hypothetical protein
MIPVMTRPKLPRSTSTRYATREVSGLMNITFGFRSHHRRQQQQQQQQQKWNTGYGGREKKVKEWRGYASRKYIYIYMFV